MSPKVASKQMLGRGRCLLRAGQFFSPDPPGPNLGWEDWFDMPSLSCSDNSCADTEPLVVEAES